MRISILPLTLLSLALTPVPATAWGQLGHKTVALLASRYFLPETAVYVRSLLSRDETIMQASTWADRFAHVPLGRFSKTWHYIDALDEPPTYCQVNYNRDCAGKDGCIVSALVNMTERIQNEELEWYDRSQALKFILHFIGDIHQPLHTENKLRGGNGIPVSWHGHPNNLHSIWDSRIIEAEIGGSKDIHAAKFAELLDRKLVSGAYAKKKHGWTQCLHPNNTEECAVSWAQDANDYICSFVLRDEVENVELTGEYAEGAVPIIEELITMAAYRLAGWLNTIVTGRSGLWDDKVAEAERRQGYLTQYELQFKGSVERPGEEFSGIIEQV